MIPLARTVSIVVAASVALSGCASAPEVVASDPTVAQAEGKSDAAMCQSADDRENPFIVEWPGTEKVALESISKRGVVVVRYVGCKLKVMQRCEAKGQYAFQPVTVHRDSMEIKDDKDLFHKLPVGSSSLKGDLKSGKTLKLDYVLVGQELAAGEPGELSGDCKGATHYVRTISVGAYDMHTTSNAKGGTDVDIGVVQAGAHTESSRDRTRQSGDVKGCADKKDIDEKNVRGYGCTAPVQLGLAPLPGLEPEPVDAADASAEKK